MQLSKSFPPNYSAIITAFPHVARSPGVIFCYGETIHAPGRDVTPYDVAHERVHSERQGSDPAGWWDRYLSDPQFRFDEELAAHIAEYRWFAGKPRNERRFMLRQIAQRLAGPLYGARITTRTAKMLITGGVPAVGKEEEWHAGAN